MHSAMPGYMSQAIAAAMSAANHAQAIYHAGWRGNPRASAAIADDRDAVLCGMLRQRLRFHRPPHARMALAPLPCSFSMKVGQTDLRHLFATASHRADAAINHKEEPV